MKAKTLFMLFSLLLILTSSACTPKISPLQNTVWILTELNGQPQKEFSSDYWGITLKLDNHTTSGKNGCGHYGGNYFILGKVLFFPGRIWVTSTHCWDEIHQRDDEFSDALKKTIRYEIQDDKFQLFNIKGEILAVFTAQNQELAGSQWQVMFFIDSRQKNVYPIIENIRKEVSLLPGTRITLSFSEDQFNGNAGCNGYFGNYETENGSLKITERGNSVMWCPEPLDLMDQETLYFEALGTVTVYRVDGYFLELRTAYNEMAVKLVRIP